MSEGVNWAGDDPTLYPLKDLLHSLDSNTADTVDDAVNPSGGEQFSQAARIKSQCIREVEQGVADIRQQLDEGQNPDQKTSRLSVAILEMAQAAAKAGDDETFRLHFNTLLGLPELYSVTLADACLAGMQRDDQRSFDTLQEALKAEMIREKTRGGTYVTVLLGHVLDYCAKNDAVPDSWIDTYSIDAQHRFQLLSGYYANLVKGAGDDNRQQYQGQLNAHVSQLLEKDTFPIEFVFGQTWYMLDQVKDPKLRSRLVQRFMKCGDSVRLTAYTFEMLNLMGNTILDDPSLANQATVNYFDRTIETCGQRLQEVGMPIFDVVSRQLHWRTKLALHHGASPQDVIDLIDLQTSSLLASDIPDREGELGQNIMRNREYVERARENLLSTCAQHFADRGDFVTANVFLSHIMSEIGLTNALNACLEKAVNSDNIRAIRPDGLTLTLNPSLEEHVKFAEARLSLTANAEKLAGVAMTYARNIQEGSQGLNHRQLRMAYEALAECDGPRAARTARELLAILRESGEPARELMYLSESLIKAGDQDEPARAKEYIDRTAKHNFERLQNIWELSKVL